VLTLFSIPKPFTGEFAPIQEAAIRSWALWPACREVLVWCEDPSEMEFVASLGENVRALSVTERNESGTPLLSAVFLEACRLASTDLVMYANGDIMFPDEATAWMAALPSGPFLLTGQRTNCRAFTPDEVGPPGWRERAQREAAEHGQPAGHWAMDHFLFRKGTLDDMKPFAVGRAGWDNAMIYEARRKRWPTIDGTDAILAIHQHHGYGHMQGGQEAAYKGAEAQRNLELIGGAKRIMGLGDATHTLGPAGLRKIPDTPARKQRAWEMFPQLNPNLYFAWRVADAVRRRVTRPTPAGGT